MILCRVYHWRRIGVATMAMYLQQYGYRRRDHNTGGILIILGGIHRMVIVVVILHDGLTL